MTVVFGPDDEVHRLVPIEIWNTGHRRPKIIVVRERTGKPTLRIADLLMLGDSSVAVEEKHPEGPAVAPSIVVLPRPNHHVAGTLSVQIAEAGHRLSKVVVVTEITSELPLGVTNLLAARDRSILVQEKDPDGSPATGPVPTGCPNRKVRNVVLVDVTDAGDRFSKPGIVGERLPKISGRLADLLLVYDGHVPVVTAEKENPHSFLPIPNRADGEVYCSVAVHVPNTRDRSAKMGIVRQRVVKAPRVRTDFALVLNPAILVKRQNVDGPAVVSASVVVGSTDGHLDVLVVLIEVAETSGRLPEPVPVAQPNFSVTNLLASTNLGGGRPTPNHQKRKNTHKREDALPRGKRIGWT